MVPRLRWPDCTACGTFLQEDGTYVVGLVSVGDRTLVPAVPRHARGESAEKKGADLAVRALIRT